MSSMHPIAQTTRENLITYCENGKHPPLELIAMLGHAALKDFTYPQIEHLKVAAYRALTLVFASFSSGSSDESSGEEEKVTIVPTPTIALEKIPPHL